MNQSAERRGAQILSKSRDEVHMPVVDVDLPGAGWRKASYSVANGQCVEAASARANVMVRDSGQPSGSVVSFPIGIWRDFLARTKAESFDASR